MLIKHELGFVKIRKKGKTHLVRGRGIWWEQRGLQHYKLQLIQNIIESWGISYNQKLRQWFDVIDKITISSTKVSSFVVLILFIVWFGLAVFLLLFMYGSICLICVLI